MSFLRFKSPLEIEIKFDNEEERQVVEIKNLNQNKPVNSQVAPLFTPNESVKGTVTIRAMGNRKVDHLGIKVQFIGCIETHSDKIQADDFISFARELAAAGEIRHTETYPFEFKNVEKQYESYNGLHVRLRYFVRVVVMRRPNDIIRERDLWVYHYEKDPEQSSIIKVDVGIEDCLHIEFEYSKSKFHLKDVIVGRIVFLLVRLRLKHMELSLVHKETTGTPPNHRSDSRTIVKFEVMDGAPVKGETIPIRLFLGGFDLTPTMKDVNKKFSSRTYLSLMLVDEQKRRYYKQSEIVLYRKEDET